MDSKLKRAIVGAGIRGENHAKIYRAHPFCKVAAICDEKRKRPG
jgi:predicted dehydrogenase